MSVGIPVEHKKKKNPTKNKLGGGQTWEFDFFPQVILMEKNGALKTFFSFYFGQLYFCIQTL